MDNHGSRERAKTGRQRSGLRAELEQMAVPFESVRRQIDGVQGWLRTVRRTEAAPVKEIAGRLGVLEREALRLETAEENGRITLGRLREVAQAMDYELVYALLPKETTFEEMALRLQREKQETRRERRQERVRKEMKKRYGDASVLMVLALEVRRELRRRAREVGG